MTVQVQTSKGLIERDMLSVSDEIVETDDVRVIQTVWRDKATGEEVRRDASASIFRGLDLFNKPGV